MRNLLLNLNLISWRKKNTSVLTVTLNDEKYDIYCTIRLLQHDVLNSISENRSFETEELPSAVETYAFNLTGTYTGEEQCYKHKDLIKDNSQRNTAVKNSGPDSWTSCGGDSGIQIV